MFVTALFSLMLAAFAGGDPALSGAWALSAPDADAVDAILAAQGVGWVERRAAGAMSMTQTISIAEQAATIAVASSMKSETLTLKVDDTVRTVSGDNGSAQVRHRWGAGGALITVSDSTAANGKPMHVEITRVVEGGVLHQRVVVSIDGQTLRADRVFTRQ